MSEEQDHPLFNKVNNKILFKQIGGNYKSTGFKPKILDQVGGILFGVSILKLLDAITTYEGISKGLIEINPKIHWYINVFGLNMGLIVNLYLSYAVIGLAYILYRYIAQYPRFKPLRLLIHFMSVGLLCVTLFTVMNNVVMMGDF